MVWIGVEVGRAWVEDKGKSVAVFSVTATWVEGSDGWSWTDSRTEVEDELKDWFKNQV